MLTLTILIAAAIADLVLSSCLLAWAARRVGSRRGRFWVALAAQLVATVLVTLVLSLRLIPVQGAARVALLLGELGIQITIWFLVLRYAFAVSAKRACALLGVEFLLGVIGLAVASGVVRPFVVESFVITTPSMSPTFVPGDRIVANKLEHPHRFDLVTYRFGSPTPYTYVKRLIALPGERLRFSGGNIFINDQRVAAPPVIEGRCHA